ncbi:MAG: M28 family peptidase, partial [Sediminibacterium sp.]
GSDFASFVAVGAPGFSLSSLSWSYFNYTWHTNRDTYDKIVFDDLQNNALLVAMLVYMACEDPETFPRDRAPIPGNATDRNGQPINSWPKQMKAIRIGPVE